MKTQAKKRAVRSADRAAQALNHFDISYQKDSKLSSLKLQVGELLLYLQTPLPQNEQQNYWQVFESCLRRYIDLRFCEGFYE
jgi:hypothetical protein